MFRLEAITVCAAKAPGERSYDDFLDVAARHNRGLFDRWVVVTTPWDKATREVCRKWNLDVLLTEEATRNGGFQKGRMVQRAQRLMAVDAWRLHLDADMVLPTHARHAIEAADLDTGHIYGADRVMVRGWEGWQHLLASGYLSHQWDYHCRVVFPKGVEVGSRFATSDQGYCPIGAFQLWHADGDEHVSFQHRAYPDRHGEASRTDTQHGLAWDRRHRHILPEVIAVHLESEECPMGTNWSGRKSKPFGPPGPCPQKPHHHRPS